MKNEGTTKKEQEELLLCETKKTFQKELSHLKKRKILTSKELIKMKEEWQWWGGLNMKKKLTPLEELQLKFLMDKRRLMGPIVERMILYYKPGPYNQYLEELSYFEIYVRDLLLQNLNLKEERDNEITGSRVIITELRAIIKQKEKTITDNEYIIELQEGNLKLKEEIIQHYEDCNIDQTDGPLRIVFNKNLN